MDEYLTFGRLPHRRLRFQPARCPKGPRAYGLSALLAVTSFPSARDASQCTTAMYVLQLDTVHPQER